ncbi:35261_t:CDS:2, partial [Gigaspora margarita]
LNAIATLIPFATVEKDLEEYYNFPRESYITYESEEDIVETEISIISTATTTSSESETEVMAISNNSINNDKDVSQHNTSKSIRNLQSRSKLFSPFKPPFKKVMISSSKSQQHYSQENQLLNAQE